MEVAMSNRNKWVSVYLNDGSVVEGVVEEEMPYGMYLHLNGNKKTLQLLVWATVSKVVYKESDVT
jgi:sRNA-binding regulator protein Hfq